MWGSVNNGQPLHELHNNKSLRTPVLVYLKFYNSLFKNPCVCMLKGIVGPSKVLSIPCPNKKVFVKKKSKKERSYPFFNVSPNLIGSENKTFICFFMYLVVFPPAESIAEKFNYSILGTGLIRYFSQLVDALIAKKSNSVYKQVKKLTQSNLDYFRSGSLFKIVKVAGRSWFETVRIEGRKVLFFAINVE